MTKSTITQCYRIPPEIDIKLRFLSIGLAMPMGRIIEHLVNGLWEKEQDKISTMVTSQKANKKVQKVLERIKMQ